MTHLSYPYPLLNGHWETFSLDGIDYFAVYDNYEEDEKIFKVYLQWSYRGRATICKLERHAKHVHNTLDHLLKTYRILQHVAITPCT